MEASEARQRLVTQAELAQYLRVSLGTLKKALVKFNVPYYEIGPRSVRYDVEEVIKHLSATPEAQHEDRA